MFCTSMFRYAYGPVKIPLNASFLPSFLPSLPSFLVGRMMVCFLTCFSPRLFLQVLGILASFAFVGDIIYFWRARGVPFKEGGRPANVNGGPVPVEAQPEREKLNTEANGV